MPDAHENTRGRDFAKGIGRAFAGALLLSLPLLMTMEMWWLGFYIDRWRLVVMLVLFFPVLTALTHFVGFDHTRGVVHDLVHAIVAYAVGMVTAAAMMLAFAVLRPGMAWHEVVGKVAVQVVPAALGASLAQSHFGSHPEKEQRKKEASYASHLFFMIVGALFVAMTLAPTDEMVLIGYQMTDAHAVVVGVLSLLLLHAFVTGMGFEGHPVANDGSALHPFFRLSVVGYALALGVSACLLWLFGRFENAQIMPILHDTVVLGFPATLGAAAARLTLDTE